MSGRYVGVLVALFVLSLLAYGLWYQRQHPREIIGTSTITVQSRKSDGGTVTLKTRDIAINGVKFSEVELPNGTWIDCQGDCRRAAREAREDFWEARARDAR
jgi:hypothetical protein